MNEQRLSEDIERLLVARNLRHMEIARAALQPGYQPWPRQVKAVWRVLSTSVQASAAGPSWEGRVGKVSFGNKTA